MHVLFSTSKAYLLSFLLVIVLAVLVSGYKLGSVPHGLTWDEAAIAYNGFSIVTTRRDEWLTKLPISFRSFGDYKAPLAIYLNGVFTAVLGLNAVSIRLPFLISSLFSVVGMMLLVELLWRGQRNAALYSICAGVLFVTSPWYVHYSRTGFESGISLSLSIWAVYFFLLFRKYRSSWAVLLSVLFFTATLYTYHSSKVVTPLLVVLLLTLSRNILFEKKSFLKLFTAGLGAVLLCFPLLNDAVSGQGLERAGVTLFSQYSFWEALFLSVRQFGLHLLPGFLVNGATTTLRHGDGNWGVLLLPTYLLCMMAVVLLLPRFRQYFSKKKYLFGLVWILIGIVPAAIAAEVPHSNRALLALPGFIILAIVVIEWVMTICTSELLRRMIVGITLLLQSLLFVAYINDYFTIFAAQSAVDFKDGYIEAFSIAHHYEVGSEATKPVEKIIFASDYGQPYIYALLVRQTNPIEYQHGSLLKYEFKDDVSVTDLQQLDTLVVATPGDITNVTPTHIVYGSDGQAKFELFLTESKY